MAEVEALFSPDGEGMGGRLVAALNDQKWTSLTAAVAFVKRSGVKYIGQGLSAFVAAHPGSVDITIGVDHGGSSIEAVWELREIVTGGGGRVFIAQNPRGSTFHPKMWLFADPADDRLLLLGSGNLTGGGMHTNYEANVCLTAKVAEQVMVDAQAFLALLRDPTRPEVVEATIPVLQRLHDQGDLPSEAEARRVIATTNSLRRPHAQFQKAQPLFHGRSVPKPPSPPMPPLPPSPITIRAATSYAPPGGTAPSAAGLPVAAIPVPAVAAQPPQPVVSATPLHRFFFITVRMADKTEVYLAKRPLDEDAAFFGAPFRGVTEPHGAGTPQPQADPAPMVRIELHTQPNVVVDNHELKMWTYTYGNNANGDFRTNFTAPLQQDIVDDSVVRFERDPLQRPDLQYVIDVFPPGHPDYAAHLAKCTTALPNSPRRYGWE